MPVAPLAPHDLRVGDRVLPTGQRCLVMGVVNVTPDSFSDGGRFLDPAAAVAAAAIAAGASMVNDVSAGRHDPDLLGVVAEARVPLVLMHMLGTPATMQDNPRYDDVVAEVEAFLAERCLAAEFAGVDHEALVVDPGIGFGKRDQDNYALLDGLARFTRLGHPVQVGTSRKAFIGRALDSPADERVEGTAATVVWAVERGARIVRVHDVAPLVRAVRMTEAMLRWGAT